MALFWGLAEPRVPASIASILLALDPLTAIGTALSDWTVVGWTWLGLAVLALTAVLGRFFCGWICPLGTLQHVVSWIAGPERRKRYKINRYRSMVLDQVHHPHGASHVGGARNQPHRLARSDPTAPPGLRFRNPAPVARWPLTRRLGVLRPPRGHSPVCRRWIPRFFCRAVCPLGALMGVFARLAPLRIHRDESGSCTSCTLCVFACQGADEPLDKHRVSECHVCLNCLGSCAEESLHYGVGQNR